MRRPRRRRAAAGDAKIRHPAPRDALHLVRRRRVGRAQKLARGARGRPALRRRGDRLRRGHHLPHGGGRRPLLPGGHLPRRPLRLAHDRRVHDAAAPRARAGAARARRWWPPLPALHGCPRGGAVARDAAERRRRARERRAARGGHSIARRRAAPRPRQGWNDAEEAVARRRRSRRRRGPPPPPRRRASGRASTTSPPARRSSSARRSPPPSPTARRRPRRRRRAPTTSASARVWLASRASARSPESGLHGYGCGVCACSAT